MKTVITSFIFLLFTSHLLSQSNKEYQSDFLQLSNIILNSIPIDDSLKKLLTKQKADYIIMLENCTGIDEFKVIAQSYIARLNDGHSKISCSLPFSRKGYYPIQYNFKNDALYISNYYNELPDYFIGKKIHAINGIPTDSIISRAKSLVSADNITGLQFYVQHSLSKVSFLENTGINIDAFLDLTIGEQSNEHFIWKRNSEKARFEVTMNDKYFEPAMEKLIKSHGTSDAYFEYQKNELSGWSNKLFEYELLDNNKTCYFKFSECYDIQYLNANRSAFKPLPVWIVKLFWWLRGGKFSTFANKMFKKLHKKGVENLIIDLRHNRGGTSILGYQLLDYLTDLDAIMDYNEEIMVSDLLKENHPEYFNQIVSEENIDIEILPLKARSDNDKAVATYLRDKESFYYQKKPDLEFRGNVYVLVGNRTFSSAAMIAVLLADNRLASVAGTPISSNPTHFGEVLDFQLENTRVKGSISCKRFYRPNKLEKENVLKINIPISNNVIDEYKGEDNELEFLLNYINVNN